MLCARQCGRAARLHIEYQIAEPGDVNSDTFVDFDDLNIVLANWSTPVPAGTLGDADCDGFVDFSDLNLVLANWGN